MHENVCKLSAEVFGYFFAVLQVALLKVSVLFCLSGSLLSDSPLIVWSRVCVCCVCGPSLRLDVSSICLACVLLWRLIFIF